MSLHDAVEGWAQVLRRFSAVHPVHGMAAFTDVKTFNPVEGFAPPFAMVLAIQPVSDNPAGLFDMAEYDLVTQVILSLGDRLTDRPRAAAIPDVLGRAQRGRAQRLHARRHGDAAEHGGAGGGAGGL